jgi:hypothetical protein
MHAVLNSLIEVVRRVGVRVSFLAGPSVRRVAK